MDSSNGLLYTVNGLKATEQYVCLFVFKVKMINFMFGYIFSHNDLEKKNFFRSKCQYSLSLQNYCL